MLPLADLAAIAAYSLVCAAAVGGLGLLVLHLTRRRSVLLQLCVVVLASMLSVTAGVVAVSQAMYVSSHDLVVVTAVAAVSTVVSVGVALVLGRRLVRRSDRLRELARAVGDGARLDPDGDGQDNTEFARLATELAQTSERLARSREELAAMDASRRELIAWISHDLRTPLAGLRAMAEALEDGLADDPQRFHRQMRSQVDRLSVMVDDLFELSKIQAGALSLAREPVSVYDLVSDAVAELAALARARDITLRAANDADLTVTGDPRELARVVGNLLVNAIQHSPPGGTISIATVVSGDGFVVLSVEDSAGGIPEAELGKIFEAGWRASTARTPQPFGAPDAAGTGDAAVAPEQLWGKTAGAGLGLTIVRGIVDAHGGEIAVRNVPGGSRFEVRLPRHPAPA